MSLADALDLLARNKSVGDEVFRDIYTDPATKYPAVKESLAAFQNASRNKRIMNNIPLVARYVRVVAVLVEQEQHVQHLSVSDWGGLAKFLGDAYEKLGSGPRDRGFVKNVVDLFRSLALLLDARESIDPECFNLILGLCEDFCGEGQQRETSCHQYIMACVRILTQCRYEKAHDLGIRLVQLGTPRQERLRQEMLAFACLVPQPLRDLISIGPAIIETHEVEFSPAPELGLCWFRPSPEADLSRFVGAKALAVARQEIGQLTAEMPPAKRQKHDIGEYQVMAAAFGAQGQLSAEALLARPSQCFWTFVVLSQKIPSMTRAQLLDAWRVATENIQAASVTSSACFCLANLVTKLALPSFIDNDVQARFETLLVAMGESSHPTLSSGSVLLWRALSQIRILDPAFQSLKKSTLQTWLSKSLSQPASSLMTTLFGAKCGIYHVDARGIYLLYAVHLFRKVENSLATLDPKELDDCDPAYETAEATFGQPSGSLWREARTVKDALWSLAIAAHSGHPAKSVEPRTNIGAISRDDIRSIFWFANLARTKMWPREYNEAALNLLEILKLELLNVDVDLKASLELSVALLEDSAGSVPAFAFGLSEALQTEAPVTAVRSLQRVFQTYALQRSPSVIRNIIVLLRDSRYAHLSEYKQLLLYFKSFIREQSPYSRLRPVVAPSLNDATDYVDMVSHSCIDSALIALPEKIKSDDLAMRLLHAFGLQGRKLAGFILLLRGASPAQVIGFLFEENLLAKDDFARFAAILNMECPQDLLVAISLPMTFGPRPDLLKPLYDFAGYLSQFSNFESFHLAYLASSKSWTDQDAALIIETIMQGFFILSSSEEKIECISRCWFLACAHSPELSSLVLKSFVKGTVALCDSNFKPNATALEPILRLILEECSTVHGYIDLAVDIAYMGLPDLAKDIYNSIDAAHSGLARLLLSFDSVADDFKKGPVLLHELASSKLSSYETWWLVTEKLVYAASVDLMALANAFLKSSERNELARILQVWTRRLALHANTLWMSFMGYLASDVDLPSAGAPLLREKGADAALDELSRVYDTLPYSKKWQLHHFYRRRDNACSSQLLDITDGFRVSLAQSNAKGPVASAVQSDASTLANMALGSLGLPTLRSTVFQTIPELIDDFVPLITAAGLESYHADQIKKLLRGGEHQRNLALRIMQRYIEANKNYMHLQEDLVDSCKLSKERFAELGIACVEAYWGKKNKDLPASLYVPLFSFYAQIGNQDYEHVARLKAHAHNLSQMRTESTWEQLDLSLLECEVSGDTSKFQRSMQDTGLWKLAYETSDSRSHYDYEQAWWMQQWDLPPAPEADKNTPPFADTSEDVYAALFNYFSGHYDLTRTFARLYRAGFTKPRILKGVLDFTGKETAASSVVRHGREVLASRSGDLERLAKELATFCCQLRNAGEVNESTKYALKLERLADTTENTAVKIMSTMESSHTAWAQGDHSLSLTLLHDVPQVEGIAQGLQQLSHLNGDYTLAKVYCRLGTWAWLTRSEPDEVILQDYFERAIECSSNEDEEQVFHHFAHFCEEASHDSSLVEDVEDLERMRTQRERELKHLKAVVGTSKVDRDNIHRRIYHLQKALANETSDLTLLLDRKTRLTLRSVESYIRSLIAGDTYGEDMGCFVALWLQLSTDELVNERIYACIAAGASDTVLLTRKFLPWMNQLTSRLGKADTDFQKVLHLVITTALERFPYHTLWQLVNIYWSGASSDTASMERKAAAKLLMQRVRARKQRSKLLRDLTACARQMLTLMKVPVDKKAKSIPFRELGSDLERWWRREFVKMDLPVPTASIPPHDDGDYSSVPKVLRVGDDVAVAGGLSSPKILRLVTSAGTTVRMVLKHGTDDLRQDSIMQQVFRVSDELLSSSKRKDLRIRTYNVIPLGPAGGAIEFVDGACSLQEAVEPLHREIGGTEEYTLSQARAKMRDVQREDKSVRLKVFEDVMAHTRPQMRFFWVLQMPDVHRWLHAKIAWAKSTAASSIIGYIVGLGDRHCSNLLVDKHSGEVIHIDLGIAFDQGRLLTIPETVPFRLTRDVEDGMGAFGVEGPFTLAARTTLGVVREQQSRIMTVLEVLKHDALYSWRLPPLRLKRGAKAGQLEGDPDEYEQDAAVCGPETAPSSTTGQAESALRGVKQKLSSPLNVDATVRDLIARARDPANLAVIYCGWSPFY